MKISPFSLLASVLFAGCGVPPAQEPPQAKNEPPSTSLSKPESDPSRKHDEFLEGALGFKSWPGKHGPLKPGLRFNPGDYPQLAGYAIKEDECDLEGSGDSVTCLRRIQLDKGSERIVIEIEVSQSETDVVQRTLLRRLGNTNMHPAIANPRGEQVGIKIGDINFITRHPELSKPDSIQFVRNNIRISIGKSSASSLDVAGLAKLLDDQIKSKSDFEKERFGSVLPTISHFEPARKIIGPFSETPLNLGVSDPQGLKLTYRFIALRGGIKYTDPGDRSKVTFFSENRAGDARIDVVVIDEALLFTRAETRVTIQ